MFHSTCPRSCSSSARSSGSVTSTSAARTSCSVSTGRPAARVEAAAANSRLRAGLRVEGQLGGPGPRRGRGLVPAAPSGPLGGVVECGDDVLVGSGHGGGQVPGAPVLLRGPGQGVRERPVRRTPPGAGRRRVDRRPDQRVPQGQGPAGLGDQAGLLGHLQRVGVRAQGARGSDDGRGPAGVVGGGDQEQRLGRRREAAVPVEERALDPFGQRQPVRQPCRTGQLLDAQCAGQLQEPERVACGGLEQLGAHRGRDGGLEPVAELVGDQRLGRVRVDTGHRQHRQVAGVEGAGLVVADREQQRDGLALQPARREQQRGRGGVVEPVRVVDDRERPAAPRRPPTAGSAWPGRPGGGRRHRRPTPRTQPRSASTCGSRERVEAGQHRPQQAVQGGERQRRLGLHAAGAQHGQAVRRGHRVLEQRRLPDSRLAAQQHRGAVSASGAVDDLGQRPSFPVPPPQHARHPSHGGRRVGAGRGAGRRGSPRLRCAPGSRPGRGRRRRRCGPRAPARSPAAFPRPRREHSG